MPVDEFRAWPSMSGSAQDAGVSSQAYWTHRVHAHNPAAGTARDEVGVKYGTSMH